ncbi:MAG: polysaccharide deacetylase family protein [Terriglobales bacterium]|jgi:peptidoglycan/xylan/chitin deacetylase (PgdA/CDA1 family)
MALSLLLKGTEWIPMEWVRPLSGVALVVPFYHMVSEAHVPHVSNLYRFRTIAEFKADLEFFTRHFEPVTLQDIVDALDGNRSLPSSCFHLTFDDGFREMHDIVAPILQRAGIPATFFLATAFLDGGGLPHYNALSVLLDRVNLGAANRSGVLARLDSILPAATSRNATLRDRILSIGYGQRQLVQPLADALEIDLDEYVRERRPHLTTAEIATLVNLGFSIGSHSHDHPLYADLALSQQLAQTRASMQLLNAKFGASPKAFAFPHNDGGVKGEFFKTVFSESWLDVSFGTSGLVSHFHPRNIQRVSVEKTAAPVSRILARQFTRATYFRLRSTEQVAAP